MHVMQADASLLSSIIMVQDLLIESQRPRSHPVHVVGVVRNPQTVKVANYMVKDLSQGTMTAELLQPDELVSGLMAQVHPHLHLLTHSQLCVLQPDCYKLPMSRGLRNRTGSVCICLHSVLEMTIRWSCILSRTYTAESICIPATEKVRACR